MAGRSRYTIDLTTVADAADPGVRAVTDADIVDLPALMLAAYADTIDDEGESLADAEAEITDWLSSGAGLAESCVTDHAVVAASLVTHGPRGPIIAYVITAPDGKGRGYGRRVVEGSLRALKAGGHTSVALWITDGNEPSERLFASLGAVRTEP